MVFPNDEANDIFCYRIQLCKERESITELFTRVLPPYKRHYLELVFLENTRLCLKYGIQAFNVYKNEFNKTIFLYFSCSM